MKHHPWVVGKDVAEVLGYKDASRALFDHVDTEDKTSLLIQQSGSNYKAKTTIINESGLYSLMLRSKLKWLPYLTCERFYLPCPYVSLRHFSSFYIHLQFLLFVSYKTIRQSCHIQEEKNCQLFLVSNL